MCWLPTPPTPDHQIKDKQTWMCGWKGQCDHLWELWSVTLLWFRRESLSDQTGEQRQKVHLNLLNCIHVSFRHVLVPPTEAVRERCRKRCKESMSHFSENEISYPVVRHLKWNNFLMMETQMEQLSFNFNSSEATFDALEFVFGDNVI